MCKCECKECADVYMCVITFYVHEYLCSHACKCVRAYVSLWCGVVWCGVVWCGVCQHVCVTHNSKE
jgi:hypothetical protein